MTWLGKLSTPEKSIFFFFTKTGFQKFFFFISGNFEAFAHVQFGSFTCAAVVLPIPDMLFHPALCSDL